MTVKIKQIVQNETHREKEIVCHCCFVCFQKKEHLGVVGEFQMT